MSAEKVFPNSLMHVWLVAPLLLLLRADWREQALLMFRILRKRALRQTLTKLEAALQQQQGGGAVAGGAVADEEAAAVGAAGEVKEEL